MCRSCEPVASLAKLSDAQLLDGLNAIENIILKATLPEWREMITLENQLKQQLLDAWNKRSKLAAKAAAAVIRRSSNPVKASAVEAALKAARREFNSLEAEMKPHIQAAVEDAMKLGISAMNKKFQGKYKGTLRYDFVPLSVLKATPDPKLRASFTLADQQAAEALSDDLAFWVGDNYDANLSESVRRIAEQSIINTGADPGRAADELEDVLAREYGYDPMNPHTGAYANIPVGWSGSTRDYFGGVAANAATMGRVGGQLSAMRGVGASSYIIVNPLDERTCAECSYMAAESAGSSMPVGDAYDHFQGMVGATPDQIRNELHPWLKLGQMVSRAGVSGKWGSGSGGKFIKAGLGFPPFHFKCRCTVDLAADSEFAGEPGVTGGES